ncbi:MAG: hypothetical protein R6W83_11300 [Cryobacterium sp.]
MTGDSQVARADRHAADLPASAVTPGPGWSLLRVAALTVLGIIGGTLLGALSAAGLVVFSGGFEIGSDGFVLVTVIVGAVVGASIAGLAALGALVALVVGDHWGTRRPALRAVIAGLGAAVTIGLSGLAFINTESLLTSAGLGVAAALSGALCAGTALYLFERHQRRGAPPRGRRAATGR